MSLWEFRGHTPFESNVSVMAIKAGFHKELWTGAPVLTEKSGSLWQFPEDFILLVLTGAL